MWAYTFISKSAPIMLSSIIINKFRIGVGSFRGTLISNDLAVITYWILEISTTTKNQNNKFLN